MRQVALFLTGVTLLSICVHSVDLFMQARTIGGAMSHDESLICLAVGVRESFGYFP
jgi:hypothetical protein